MSGHERAQSARLGEAPAGSCVTRQERRGACQSVPGRARVTRACLMREARANAGDHVWAVHGFRTLEPRVAVNIKPTYTLRRR
mmetsp:Transcript_10514/g.27975  ORF Transcript_10514/g.27975 Transcript_10514/m.27975 type:complete len:83 (+) Transcript_10514:136-384(+)